MLLGILRYIRGYLCIRVSGRSVERFLNACSYRGIRLWNIKPVRDTYEMNITIRGFRQIRPIARRAGVGVVITQRIGLPFFLHRYRRRRLFFAGAAACVFLIFLLSHFIWDIDIRGNLTRTDETILEFLGEHGVESGMRISEADCAQIAKDIRREYDDIIWVSASIEGTRLIVQIRENEDSAVAAGDPSGQTEGETEAAPTDIVADADCVITDMITRRGVPQVSAGAQVKAGDILVSGQVPVNDDTGTTVDYQYQESDADILGKTVINYEDSISLIREEKEFHDIEKKEYFLRAGRFRLGFGSVRNRYEHFEARSSETEVKLFGGLSLPVSFGLRTAVPYTVTRESLTKGEYQRALSAAFSKYCKDLEKKGVEIIENDVKIYTGSKEAQARGTLTVIMPVGESRPSVLMEADTPAEENGQSGEIANGNDGSGN